MEQVAQRSQASGAFGQFLACELGGLAEGDDEGDVLRPGPPPTLLATAGDDRPQRGAGAH
nr:hypothetical protein [Nonomuraea turkmeniaca]